MGLFQPVIREVIKMRYLWRSPQELIDPKLDAILGDGFGTNFERAVAETTLTYLPETELEKLKGMKRAPMLLSLRRCFHLLHLTQAGRGFVPASSLVSLRLLS